MIEVEGYVTKTQELLMEIRQNKEDFFATKITEKNSKREREAEKERAGNTMMHLYEATLLALIMTKNQLIRSIGCKASKMRDSVEIPRNFPGIETITQVLR